MSEPTLDQSAINKAKTEAVEQATAELIKSKRAWIIRRAKKLLPDILAELKNQELLNKAGK